MRAIHPAEADSLPFRGDLVDVDDHPGSAFQATVDALAMLVEARDSYTGEHGSEVSDLALRLGLAVGCGSADLCAIEAGGRLHDIGKIAVPDAILQKPGELSEDEWEVMRAHPEIGAEIVGRIPVLRAVAVLIRAHHERWDGTGYPDHLAGEEIPLGARVLAVADSYYAITTWRPYHGAHDRAHAVAEIVRCSGTQFDPSIVRALQGLSFIRYPL